MVIKKRSKLSIVTAFIVGTTMFSSIDKAWGMSEEEARKEAASHVAAAPRFFLAGMTRVNEETCKAAEVLLDDLTPDVAVLDQQGLALRKLLIKPSTRSYRNIDTLMKGGLTKVMADLTSETSSLPLNDLITESLKRIKFAIEDPYDIITRDQSKPAISAEDVEDIKKSLLVARKEAKLSEFLSGTLPNVLTSYPPIVNSLLARFPREEGEIQQQKRNLEIYFTGKSTKKKLSKAQKKRQREEREQKRQEQFNNLAEALFLLKQINDRPAPSPVSSSVSLDPGPSSSMGSVKTFRTTGANPSARMKHSAVAIQLSNQDLQADAYELVVNHRTREKGPMVRIYDPKAKSYNDLEALPVSPDFCDTSFNITLWARNVREDSSVMTDVATYLSFLNGKSDIHSFKICSREKILKEIVFGDVVSEKQPGIHVYGPEISGDANEWSEMQSDDLLK